MQMNKAAVEIGPFGFAVMVISLLFTAGHANAFSCVGIADSEKRLSCYDAAVLCQVKKVDGDRLACFDQAFDRAQSSLLVQPDSAVPADVATVVSGPMSSEAVTTEVRQANVSRQTSVETVPPAEAISVGEQIRSQKVGSKSTTSKVDEGKFGLPDRGLSEDANYVEAVIVRVQTNAHRIDYLKLDNGQVWREVEDGRLRFKAGQKVRIEAGLLSSYKLKIVGKNLSVKVKRTQ
ncbi:MAG: hypothetical protein ACJAVI_004208 [Candidatus Azotimanducaceae bacterium]|jgi:hypothetical protein